MLTIEDVETARDLAISSGDAAERLLADAKAKPPNAKKFQEWAPTMAEKTVAALELAKATSAALTDELIDAIRRGVQGDSERQIRGSFVHRAPFGEEDGWWPPTYHDAALSQLLSTVKGISRWFDGVLARLEKPETTAERQRVQFRGWNRAVMDADALPIGEVYRLSSFNSYVLKMHVLRESAAVIARLQPPGHGAIPDDGTGTTQTGGSANGTPRYDFSDLQLSGEDVRFLQAAWKIGARRGEYITSNKIAATYLGAGAACPRTQRERLIEKAGLLTSKRYIGVSLTEKGEEYLRFLQQIT